jgi:hypothetical protein
VAVGVDDAGPGVDDAGAGVDDAGAGVDDAGAGVDDAGVGEEEATGGETDAGGGVDAVGDSDGAGCGEAAGDGTLPTLHAATAKARTGSRISRRRLTVTSTPIRLLSVRPGGSASKTMRHRAAAPTIPPTWAATASATPAAARPAAVSARLPNSRNVRSV